MHSEFPYANGVIKKTSEMHREVLRRLGNNLQSSEKSLCTKLNVSMGGQLAQQAVHMSGRLLWSTSIIHPSFFVPYRGAETLKS